MGNIEFAVNYIRELVPVRFEIKKLARDEFPEYSEDAYREAIINAVVHRDYFNGDEIAVEKLKSSIIINNKGELLFDKNEFGKKSEQRNRLIADLLSKTIFMEKVGTGIKRIRSACQLNKNRVEFEFNDSFWVNIYTNKINKDNVLDNVPNNVPDKRIEKIVELMQKNDKITISELAEFFVVNDKTIKRDID